MTEWNVVFYKKPDGTAPAREFLEKLPVKHHAKALREIDLLEKWGPALTKPHVKHIDGELWELRVNFAGDASRIFYFIHTGQTIVLLHGFMKKTQKTPIREIETAKSAMADYLAGHGA